MKPSLRATRAFLLCALLCTCSAGVDSPPAFGFQVKYEIPFVDPTLDYGDGGPAEIFWLAGPHANFESLDPRALALDSLAWFESAPEADEWRVDPGSRLALVYPSRNLTITACHVDGGELSWEQELRAWFERFPPGGDGAPEVGEVAYPWTVDFGARGEVRGVAETDVAALAELKAVAASLGPAPLFAGPSFSLLATVRRSSHEMDVFGADVDGAAELDELPRLVSEKRRAEGR